MAKRVTSIVLGLMTGFLVVFIVDMLTGKVFNIPNVDPKNTEAIKALMSTIPVGALIMMLAGWLLSSFLGGMVAAKIDRENWMRNSLVVGVILMIGALMNFYYLPHPVWMVIVAVAGYIPAAYAGGRLMRPY
jgi:hypothetical protein